MGAVQRLYVLLEELNETLVAEKPGHFFGRVVVDVLRLRADLVLEQERDDSLLAGLAGGM